MEYKKEINGGHNDPRTRLIGKMIKYSMLERGTRGRIKQKEFLNLRNMKHKMNAFINDNLNLR